MPQTPEFVMPPSLKALTGQRGMHFPQIPFEAKLQPAYNRLLSQRQALIFEF
jgi:hypothetical protein